MQKESKLFWALLPGLSSEVGHIYHYHLSVERAVSSLGWKYQALIPMECQIAFLPPNWRPFLANEKWDRSKTFLSRLKTFFINAVRLRSFFCKIKDQKEAVIFLEHFELQFLAAFAASLLFRKPKFQVWILHRYAYGNNHLKTKVFAFFHKILERKLGKERVTYLTDSDLLAKEQRTYFQRDIHVVPIPHTRSGGEKKEKKGTLLWWPGGSIREDKGLSFIQKIAALLPENGKIKLLLAEKAQAVFPSSKALFFLPTTLNEEEYKSWMKTADFILLPYSLDYAHRTSGIFVEAVCLGSIPIVSEGTWMAYELEKYGLLELIQKKEPAQFLDSLEKLIYDVKMKKKLQKMREDYSHFHSEKGFSLALSQISKRF